MTKTLFTTLMALVSLCMYAQENIDYGPTMGWSSWNTFELNIDEQTIKGQADAMVSKGLLAVGYNHINIDDGYFGGRDSETGQLLIHKTRFPNGLAGIVDYIHKKGLKAGIYSDGGYNTCGSYHGGDKTGEGVGLYKHDQQDCDFFFKELGFDFIKVDFCGGDPIHNKDKLDLDEKERYTAIAKAIKNTGRTDVRMNICRWAYPGTWADEAGFSWRTTGDINPSWGSVKSILAENLYMSAYCSKGHYNDMDMLEVGVEKWGNKLTAEENKTHFGMWCIMNSPLLIGCNIKNLDTTTLNLLKNKELIALNQDTLYQQAYLACKTNNCYIMVKDIETRYGNKRAVALYNPNDASKIVVLNFKDIDLADSVTLRDCFTKRNLNQKYYESYQIVVPAHGVKIYVAEAESRLERTCYEAETGYCNAYSEITGNVCQYSEASNCSGGYKAGWLGNSEKNDLQWRSVYSRYGGKYKMKLDYICGDSRNVTISVNGKKVKTLSCNSGGWDKVGTKTIDIELMPGENIIRLSNASGWMPDIDCMRLECQIPASINAVKNTKQRNKIYNLQGIELSNKELLPKGIYIIDGKKSKVN